MSELDDEVDSSAHVSPVVSVGRVLSLAREGAGMSVEEAAAKLRLSVRQVTALEADDASVLPSPAFVRGFIRNYAKLLELNAEELLQAYPGQSGQGQPVNISLQSENIPIHTQEKRLWLPYLMASMVVGVALAGWLFYMEYADQTLRKDASANPVETKPTAVAAVPQPLPVELTPEQVSAAAVPVAVSAVQPETLQPAVPATSAKLVLTVKESSWISVTDRDGKELLNKSHPAGSQAVVEGVPPFSIIIGNSAGVALSYNDKPVDLVPYTKANVARLTLE